MTTRRIALLVLAIGGIAFAAVRIAQFRDEPRGAEVDFPGGLSYVCNDCARGFNLTVKQFAKIYGEQQNASSVPCPDCGPGKAVRADVCPNCGTYSPASLNPYLPVVCPRCKAK